MFDLEVLHIKYPMAHGYGNSHFTEWPEFDA